MTKSIVTRIILLTLFLKVDNVLTPKFIYFTLEKKKKHSQLTLTVTYGVFLNLGIRIQISKRQKLTIAPEVEHKLKSVNCSVEMTPKSLLDDLHVTKAKAHILYFHLAQ